MTADCRDAGVRFSVGYELTVTVGAAILEVPEAAWVQAIDAGGKDRDGAWVAELTDRLDLSAWPEGSRLICRIERPHQERNFRSSTITVTGRRAFSPTSTATTSPS